MLAICAVCLIIAATTMARPVRSNSFEVFRPHAKQVKIRNKYCMKCTLVYDSSKANKEVAARLQSDLERVRETGMEMQEGLRAAEAQRQAASDQVGDPMFGLGGKRDGARNAIDKAEQACLDTTVSGTPERDSCLREANGGTVQRPAEGRAINPEDYPVKRKPTAGSGDASQGGTDAAAPQSDPRGARPDPKQQPHPNVPPETLPPPASAPFTGFMQGGARPAGSAGGGAAPSKTRTAEARGDGAMPMSMSSEEREQILAGEPHFVSPEQVQDVLRDSLSINDLTSMQQGQSMHATVELFRSEVCVNLPSRQLVYSLFRGLSNADETPGASVRCEAA